MISRHPRISAIATVMAVAFIMGLSLVALGEEVTVRMPKLTKAEEEKAISIAKADTKVQKILAQGATIYKVVPMFRFGTKVTETGEVKEFSGALASVEIAFEPSDVHGKRWHVWVDLEEGKVADIREIDPALMKSSGNFKYGRISDKAEMPHNKMKVEKVCRIVDDEGKVICKGEMGRIATDENLKSQGKPAPSMARGKFATVWGWMKAGFAKILKR